MGIKKYINHILLQDQTLRAGLIPSSPGGYGGYCNVNFRRTDFSFLGILCLRISSRGSRKGMAIIMKKAQKFSGARKFLTLGLVLTCMGMATACTNNDKDNGSSDNMAGNGTQESGVAGQGSGSTAGSNNANNDNETYVGNGVGEGGAAQGDNPSLGDSLSNVVDDVVDGIDDIANDITGNGSNSGTGIDGTNNGTSTNNGTNTSGTSNSTGTNGTGTNNGTNMNGSSTGTTTNNSTNSRTNGNVGR